LENTGTEHIAQFNFLTIENFRSIIMQFSGAEGAICRSFFCSQTLPVLLPCATHTLDFDLKWETAQPVEVLASVCFHVDPDCKLPTASCSPGEISQEPLPVGGNLRASQI
jgi:hypothetical protein